MGWQKRQNGLWYYYRAKRVGDRVVTRYIGGGETGRRAAAEDAARREAERLQRISRDQLAREVAEVTRKLDSVSERTDTLITTQLLLNGWRKHHRQWKAPRHDNT